MGRSLLGVKYKAEMAFHFYPGIRSTVRAAWHKVAGVLVGKSSNLVCLLNYHGWKWAGCCQSVTRKEMGNGPSRRASGAGEVFRSLITSACRRRWA